MITFAPKRMRLNSLILSILAAGTLSLSAGDLAAQARDGSGAASPTRSTQNGRDGRQNPVRGGAQENEGSPFFGEGSEVDPAVDTVKKPRVRLPLESYHFDMEERSRLNLRWTVDPYANHLRLTPVDTLQADFQIDYPFMQRGVGSAYLGNLGAPSQWLSFFDRPVGRNHSFSNPWEAYLRTVETMPFFNTKTMFSQVGYTWAGQKIHQEESFMILVAQNISPQTGFNLDYRSLGTKGVYSWQAARDKRFSMGLNHTAKRWTLHAGYIHNRVFNQENGGVTDDGKVTEGLGAYEQLTMVPMRMSSATNTIRGNTFFLHQSYGVPLIRVKEDDFTIADRPAFYVGHAVELDRWSKRYDDTWQGTIYTDPRNEAPPLHYYDEWLYSPTASRDSLFEGRLSNRLFIQLQPWDRAGAVGTIDAGVGVDALKYYRFSADRYLTGVKGAAENETHVYAYGAAGGHVGKYADWRADLKVHPLGARAGDTEMGGEISARLFIKERPVSVTGRLRFRTEEPDYWSRNYSSNHYMWSNSFTKENETRLEGLLEVPHAGFSATVSQSVLGSRVYFGPDARPVQATDAVSVTGVYLREDLPIGIGASSVNLNHRVMLQWSTDQKVVPVPLASVYLSYFYDFVVARYEGNEVLRLQVGVDGRYNTRYHAPGYNPGTGQFYNQREKELGDYIWLDAFVSAKWKRMRLRLKMQHLSDDMLGSTNFFSVLHYPMNRRILKLGLSWNFYD
jgi:hypothetical protein